MRYQNRVLGMLSLMAVITYLDRVCIAVAGPRMQDALQISPEGWGWVTSIFFLSSSAFEIPTARWEIAIGPRRPHPRGHLVVGLELLRFAGRTVLLRSG